MLDIKTFNSNEGLKLTAISFNGKEIFLPSEIESQIEYSDLSDSIRNTDSMLENIDYIILSGDNLSQIKKLMNKRSNTPPQISSKAKSLIVLTESGLYAVLMKSKKQQAVKFRVWITNEVLPTLRKKGSYSISQEIKPINEELASRGFKAMLEIADMMQCPKHVALSEISKQINERYGVDTRLLITSSSVSDNIHSEEVMLEPTELGSIINVSAIRMNQILEEKGMQRKNNSGWEPTEKGSLFSTRHFWQKGSKSGYNMKWKKSILKILI